MTSIRAWHHNTFLADKGDKHRCRAGRWAAVPQSDWPTAKAQRDIILQDFDPADTAIGDRRQVLKIESMWDARDGKASVLEQSAGTRS